MSSKTITVNPVSLQDSLMFLWKIRNKVSNLEYEIYSMVNRRHQLNFPDGQGNFPSLAIIDVEQDIADENLAENLFMELRDAVTNFLDSYSGVTVTVNNNNNIDNNNNNTMM